MEKDDLCECGHEIQAHQWKNPLTGKKRIGDCAICARGDCGFYDRLKQRTT